MAIKSYSLTTVQRAADFLGLGTITSGSTKDTLLERMIDSVTEFVENYIGYRVQQTTYTNEEYDTEKSDTLLLNNFPVSTFTRLQRRNSALNDNDWETIDSNLYHVDLESGVINGAGGWLFARTRKGYRCTYIAGYDFDLTDTFLQDTEAADLELAAWLLVSTVFNRGKGGVGIKSEAIGDYRVVYAKSLMENEDIKALLDKYKRIEVLGPLIPRNT